MKRRSLLQTTAAVTALGASRLRAQARVLRSNVVVVFVQGPGQTDGIAVLRDLSPNGVLFSQVLTPAAMTPAMSQLLSGNHCLHNRACLDAAGRYRMRRDMPTVAELFRQDGYITGFFGAWPLGPTYPDRPQDRGFDRAVWMKGGPAQSAIDFDNDMAAPRYLDGAVELQAAVPANELAVSECLAWTARQDAIDQPFFAFVAAQAGRIEDQLVKLHTGLVQNKSYDDTILVLLQDSRAYVAWPVGIFNADVDIAVGVQPQDFLPTLLDLCDVPPGNNSFDGDSLAPLLRGGQIPVRKLVVFSGGGSVPRRGDLDVLWGQWRLKDASPSENLAARHADVFDELREYRDQWWEEREAYLHRPLPCFIGAGVEYRERLSCLDWWEESAGTTEAVQRGAGGPTGGLWHLQVFTTGEYELELRRWPEHTGRALGIPAREAIILLDGTEQRTPARADDLAVKIRIILERGRSRLQAWFIDSSGSALSGAYYASLVRLN